MEITSEDVIDALYTLGDEVDSFHIGEREMSLRDLYETCRMAPEMTWSADSQFRNLAGYFVCALGDVVVTNRHNQAASTLQTPKNRVTGAELLGVWGRLPHDTTTFGHPGDSHTMGWWLPIQVVRDLCQNSPNDLWHIDTYLLGPKGHKICAIKDLFGEWVDEEVTRELDLKHLGCRHQAAAAPMQNPQDNLKWWLYCKACGHWMSPFKTEAK